MPGKRDAANLDEVTQMHESFCAVEGNAESHRARCGRARRTASGERSCAGGAGSPSSGSDLVALSDLVACQWFRPRVSPSRFTP